MKSTNTRSFGSSCRLDGHRIENWPGAIGWSSSTLTSTPLASAGSNPALGLLQGMTAQSANPDSAQFYKDRALTLLINFAAAAIVARSRSGAETDG